VAWLLALPPLALVLIAPPALGAFAASRQPTLPPPTIQARPTGEAAPNGSPSLFAPLIPPGDGAAVPMSLAEYLARDYEEPHTLAGVRIRLVGFVTPQPSGRDGYLLTRFAINCCAADATALKVTIHGDPVPRAPTPGWRSRDAGRSGPATTRTSDSPAHRCCWPSRSG
jgi:uncharacterized repeat protein (TIGR03943 family)